MKNNDNDIDPHKIISALDTFLIQINKIEMQIKKLHVNKQNKIF